MEEKISVILDLSYFMLDSAIVYKIMQSMLEQRNKRYSKWRFMMLLYSIFLLKYITGFLDIDYLDTPLVGTVITVGVYIGIFLITVVFFKGRVSEKIVLVFTYIMLASTVELFLILFSMVFFHISKEEIMENYYIFYFELGCSKIIQLFFVQILGKRKTKKKSFIQFTFTFEIACIIVFDFIFLILGLLIIRWNKVFIENAHIYFAIMLAILFTISFVFIIVILKLIKRRNEELELKSRIQTMELEKKYNARIQEMEQRLRVLRHDMNNHMNVMKGLLYLEEYDELKKYFNEIDQELEMANNVLVLEEKALSVLLNEKVRKAREAEIALELEVSKEKINMPVAELCALTGNLLDNAIEAVEKVNEQKYIYFSLAVYEDKIEMFCRNPYKGAIIGKEGGGFLTTKEDKEQHGWGTKQIREIVEKNNGKLEISYDSEFCVHITI